jgi:hypothetical protein
MVGYGANNSESLRPRGDEEANNHYKGNGVKICDARIIDEPNGNNSSREGGDTFIRGKEASKWIIDPIKGPNLRGQCLVLNGFLSSLK